MSVASNRARRFTEEKWVSNFWSKVDKNGPIVRPELGPCWIWTGLTIPSGYGFFSRDRRIVYAHRFSWSLLHGALAPGVVVRHRCDNPPCVCPSHLLAGTHRDNTQDMMERGRGAHGTLRGEEQPMAVLCETQVLEIRRLYALGAYRQVDLAEWSGVSQRTISAIVRRKTWSHV